ncbi:DUF2802 domain-containing protein [Vibrio sp. SM6]|uniref:DUF2802 domain-containing protein n=1 Tax=Vibrio agarilyticus TaxID=2726741 RepID=A0A7X8YHD8_9VIBR|nr:DUF2802 domain-containing protein [Vibrio agarilyticus]NLS13252.1 DUF2802 domain-containing protein [Vibrio agarilyticus]
MFALPSFESLWPLIAAGMLILFVLVLVVLRRSVVVTARLEAQRQKLRHSEKELQKASKQLVEMRSVVIGLGQRLTEQLETIQLLEERVIELENADTDGRLYSRATKMVQLGADINELIEECELPKAEAELMLSLQKKLAGKEAIPPLQRGLHTSAANRSSSGSRHNSGQQRGLDPSLVSSRSTSRMR